MTADPERDGVSDTMPATLGYLGGNLPRPGHPAGRLRAPVTAVLPVGLAIWVSALRYLIRGAIAANRGERSEAPDWICAHIVG